MTWILGKIVFALVAKKKISAEFPKGAIVAKGKKTELKDHELAECCDLIPVSVTDAR